MGCVNDEGGNKKTIFFCSKLFKDIKFLKQIPEYYIINVISCNRKLVSILVHLCINIYVYRREKQVMLLLIRDIDTKFY